MTSTVSSTRTTATQTTQRAAQATRQRAADATSSFKRTLATSRDRAAAGAKTVRNRVTSPQSGRAPAQSVGGRVVTVDADALIKFDQLKISSLLREGDQVVTTLRRSQSSEHLE